MDWSRFGLSRDPFERSPDLDDACLPNTIAALLSELQSGLRSPQGVSVLVGDSGSGKSIAAAAFARRLRSFAHVVLLSSPTSSVSAIARDALGALDGDGLGFSLDDDWTSAFRDGVRRRGEAGRATVLVLDDAQRLSPQTLEDLAGLFADAEADDEETLRLHVFLFGRPRLLDRMHAGPERALHAHLLQICRLEPLGVRESVRYLERRLAICGGELAAMFSDDAIDETVQKAAGRLQRLEAVAAEALRRALRRGATRAAAEDVVAIAVPAVVEEEEAMAVKQQQPLRFELSDDDEGDTAPEWGDESGEADAVEWGDEDDDGEESWQADDEDSAAEEGLRWDTAAHRLEDEEEDEADEEDVVDGPRPRAAVPAGKTSARRRMVGPAVLSLAACLALVWAANHVPGPGEDVHHGRDATLFAEPLSTAPEQILRLAKTAEAADADAQVVAWREHRSEEKTEAPAAVEARAAEPAQKPSAATATRGASAATPGGDELVAGPMLPAAGPARAGVAEARPALMPASLHAQSAGRRGDVMVAPKPAKDPESQRSIATASKRGAAAAVFTVQLGAFKTRRNAEDLATRLRGKPTRILEEGGFYRVMSGSFANRREAALHEATLKRAGYTTFVRTASF